MHVPGYFLLTLPKQLFFAAAFLCISLGFLPDAAAQIAWFTGPWPYTCDASCQQPRAVQCMDSLFPVPDTACLTMGLPKPADTQDCYGDSCLADWITGSCSSCSVSCGSGTYTCTVTCKLGTTVMSDQNCNPYTRPDSVFSCTGTGCVYQWTTGAWSACDAPCGTGAQTRSVQCMNVSLGTIVSASYCDAGSMPATTQSCEGASCTYEWDSGGWSACDVPCGTGSHFRTVTCVEDFTNEVVDDSYCTEARPAEAETCEGLFCDYGWVSGAWSVCSVSCGPGSQDRSVACQESFTGAVVDDAYCTGTKPAGAQDCTGVSCTYSWAFGPWSECSVECGTGSQTRQIDCLEDLSGDLVPGFLCQDPEPVDWQLCEGTNCEYTWETGDWSGCSAECGGGTALRAVWCVQSGTGDLVEFALCDSGSEPAAEMVCNEAPCLGEYAWLAGEWGPCSATCEGQNPGMQTRDVYCLSSDLTIVDDSHCELLAAPESTQACNSSVVCPAYEWATSDWSECTDGTQTRMARCTDSTTGEGVADSLCLADELPAQTQECTVDEASNNSGGCSVSPRSLTGTESGSGPNPFAALLILAALLLFPRRRKES